LNTHFILTAAIAGLVSAALVPTDAVAQEKAAKKERCYGVAKKGMNDCGTATHSCAGKAKADNQVDEWKYIMAGECKKMGGGLSVAEAEAAKKEAMKNEKKS
jgi:uncharacterized membrane protein